MSLFPEQIRDVRDRWIEHRRIDGLTYTGYDWDAFEDLLHSACNNSNFAMKTMSFARSHQQTYRFSSKISAGVRGR